MGSKTQDKRLRQIYKITKAEQDREIREQGNGCAICGRPFPMFRSFQDHFHECCPRRLKLYCGKCTRGVLCYICNKFVVGYMEKQNIDPNKLAAYMNKWKAILIERGVVFKGKKGK
jgi:hypothetical protein